MQEGSLLFNLYSKSGKGIIDAGYYQDSSCFLQITGGNVVVSIGTETAEAQAGDFLFVPSSMVFRVESYDGSASIRVLTFNREFAEENMDNFDGEINYMFYVQSFSRIVMFRKGHPIHEQLSFYMNEAYEEFMSRDVCFRMPVRANIYLLLSTLLRYYASSKTEMDRMIYHNVIRLRPVIEYISEHYGEKTYIETLSEMITVSPDYFTKMFKDSIGTTPIDYINGVSVNHALRLLTMTATPVNEIAEMTGFSNPNYFHKIFKSYMTTSPLAYRKSVMK